MRELALRRQGWRAGLASCAAIGAAVALSGCLETAAELAPKSEGRTQIARRDGVSLADASVAFVSVEGPPAAISARFSQRLLQEAAAREIAVVDAKNAKYLVRGYLSAYVTADGAAVEYVWDVFNKEKQRAQRVNDVIDVKGEGADPWTIASETALASVAAKSADDLAAFLSNTPEAIALAKTPGELLGASVKPLSYAPLQ